MHYILFLDAGDQERGQGSETCIAHFRPGCGLWALLTKIAQRSLGGLDGQSGLEVTICAIWLGWRVDLLNFSRDTVQAIGNIGIENYIDSPGRLEVGCGRLLGKTT